MTPSSAAARLAAVLLAAAPGLGGAAPAQAAPDLARWSDIRQGGPADIAARYLETYADPADARWQGYRTGASNPPPPDGVREVTVTVRPVSAGPGLCLLRTYGIAFREVSDVWAEAEPLGVTPYRRYEPLRPGETDCETMHQARGWSGAAEPPLDLRSDPAVMRTVAELVGAIAERPESVEAACQAPEGGSFCEDPQALLTVFAEGAFFRSLADFPEGVAIPARHALVPLEHGCGAAAEPGRCVVFRLGLPRTGGRDDPLSGTRFAYAFLDLEARPFRLAFASELFAPRPMTTQERAASRSLGQAAAARGRDDPVTFAEAEGMTPAEIAARFLPDALAPEAVMETRILPGMAAALGAIELYLETGSAPGAPEFCARPTHVLAFREAARPEDYQTTPVVLWRTDLRVDYALRAGTGCAGLADEAFFRVAPPGAETLAGVSRLLEMSRRAAEGDPPQGGVTCRVAFAGAPPEDDPCAAPEAALAGLRHTPIAAAGAAAYAGDPPLCPGGGCVPVEFGGDGAPGVWIAAVDPARPEGVDLVRRMFPPPTP